MFSMTTPPRAFAMISLLIILVMLIATGITQTLFFRQTIIERESVIVRDMVNALAIEHFVSAADMVHYTNDEAIRHFNRSFSALRNLTGTNRIKVFNRDQIIIWSDAPELVGTKRNSHSDDLAQALHGDIRAVFNPAITNDQLLGRKLTIPESIEIYMPIFNGDMNKPSATVIGALALYRSPHGLNKAIRHGLYLLWGVIGAAGVILFAALYKLFDLIYKRQKTAELQFSKLTADHERIVQIEKLSAMGELVGEIAHQLNNPLVGVINLAQLAEREVDNPQRVCELLVEVRKAGTECRDIVQRILRINRISRSEPQATDIKELIRDTITFCNQSVGRHHVLEFEASAQEVMLNVDPVLIRHALFNLIHNAILAAPESPVTVSLADEEYEGNPGYALTVTDRGSGFDAEVAAKLFKPFFTTRSGGTGLGLSVAQHIVMKHGGTIHARNLPTGGARFSIWLPAITTL